MTYNNIKLKYSTDKMTNEKTNAFEWECQKKKWSKRLFKETGEFFPEQREKRLENKCAIVAGEQKQRVNLIIDEE